MTSTVRVKAAKIIGGHNRLKLDSFIETLISSLSNVNKTEQPGQSSLAMHLGTGEYIMTGWLDSLLVHYDHLISSQLR